MDQKSRFKLMKERAEAVQTVVTEVKDHAAAFRYALELTKKQGGATLAAPGWDEDSLAAIKKRCEKEKIELLTENLRPHANRIHTGLTRADWGIADTGSLVIDSSAEDLRLATMLAETHVAVLPASRIVPDSVALKDELDRLLQSPPRYLAFITGPSRTADIEYILTIGVHGPGELHLLVVKEKGK
jgi:L-lactate dehydrogenase complex protein LldG